MQGRLQLYIWMIVLICLGLGSTAYKNLSLGFPLVPGKKTTVWTVQAKVNFVGLGYLGVDVVLDRDRGPLILELNARPGLAIQIANGMGMTPRVEQVNHEIIRKMRPRSFQESADWSMKEFQVG